MSKADLHKAAGIAPNTMTRLRREEELSEYHKDQNIEELADLIKERLARALKAERTVRGYIRNLVVAATGTGKTVISALDYKRFRRPKAYDADVLHHRLGKGGG